MEQRRYVAKVLKATVFSWNMDREIIAEKNRADAIILKLLSIRFLMESFNCNNYTLK